MPKIIPAIIAKTVEELTEKIRLVEPYFDIFQLDVMDGKFVPNDTIMDTMALKKIKTSLRWEIHLMAEEPEKLVYQWSELKPQRFIFHYEAIKSYKIKALIQKIKNYGMEVGTALNPGTSVEVAKDFLSDLDMILLMSVHPGFGRQEFIEATLEKIRVLRQLWPDGIIEVDGGIKIGIAKQCIEAGADILVVGSAIVEAKNIKEAVQNLKDSIK